LISLKSKEKKKRKEKRKKKIIRLFDFVEKKEERTRPSKS